MPMLFAILLKINLVLLLFAAAYYLILRRLTFYTINRIFLVFGILFSTLYPFIDLTEFFHQQEHLNEKVVALVPQLNETAHGLVPARLIMDYWGYLSLLFYVGVVVMAFRLITQFISLYVMHRKSRPGAVGNVPVRILAEAVSPFSFWRTVYVNPSLHAENELRTILAHEQIHVKEWHSLDILLAELSVVFYWFNPGVWLMKKAVKENLEFITDQKILNRGMDRKTYQYSLLDVGSLNPAVKIVNNFNLSDLKKRIQMMNVKRSSKLTLSRYLLITPLLLLTTMAFTISKKEIKTQLKPLTQALSPAVEVVEAMLPVKETDSKTLTKTATARVRSKAATLKKSEDLPDAILLIRDTTDERLLAVEKQPKMQIRIRHININPDSSSSALARIQSFKSSGLQSGTIVENLLRDDAAPGSRATPKVVTVKGYYLPAKKGSLKGERQLILKGINTPDTAIFGKSQIYINGKLTSPAELGNMNPDEIASIEIFKEKPRDEVVVVGRKSP